MRVKGRRNESRRNCVKCVKLIYVISVYIYVRLENSKDEIKQIAKRNYFFIITCFKSKRGYIKLDFLYNGNEMR